MDVAGGRGSLSFELCQKRGIPCTVVDPRLADGVTGTRLTRSQARWVKENGREGMLEPEKFAALLTPSQYLAALQDAGAASGGEQLLSVLSFDKD